MARMDPHTAFERAVSAIGCGYNLANDLRLSSCKEGPSGSRLIELHLLEKRDLVVPFPGSGDSIVVKDVPNVIKCDKGEVMRFSTDSLPFNRMSEKLNQEMGLSGKIPSGTFNYMFGLRGRWQQDASSLKSLAYDGWFISLCNIELEKTHIKLSKQVKQEVPSSWDPAALAGFIEKYGTHIVVGIKMGGKDVIYAKQLQNSNLEPQEVQKLLTQYADEKFSKRKDASRHVHRKHQSFMHLESMRPSPDITPLKSEEVISLAVRRGGVDIGQSHEEWLSTIMESPDVISASFVPITSLLSGVRGNGFLSHAINLYLRYKPPIEELQQFMEFQLPRQWAPMYGDLPLSHRSNKQASPVLRFSLMGPKLYVNTAKVDSGNRPVTGMRLYLEGRRCDRLAIHLQHLSSLPETFQISEDNATDNNLVIREYLEPVNWSIFSHVYTAPVEHNDDESSPCIVTKAWFEVKSIGMKKVLFLRLGFATVNFATIRRNDWDETTAVSRKSGVFSSLISTRFSAALSTPEKVVKVDINSAVYPGGPPLSARALKMSNLVETREMIRGPEDIPGYWVVTGAKLCVDNGKISIKVKYSLLAMMTEDSLAEHSMLFMENN